MKILHVLLCAYLIFLISCVGRHKKVSKRTKDTIKDFRSFMKAKGAYADTPNFFNEKVHLNNVFDFRGEQLFVAKVLGQGAFGKVYRVTWKGRYYVLKVYFKVEADNLKKRFSLIDGIKNAAYTEDDNLLKVMNYAFALDPNVKDGNQIQILQEYVPGVTLDKLIKMGFHCKAIVLSIIKQSLNAFTLMIELGMKHGDIKLENIMYDMNNAKLKVIDTDHVPVNGNDGFYTNGICITGGDRLGFATVFQQLILGNLDYTYDQQKVEAGIDLFFASSKYKYHSKKRNQETGYSKLLKDIMKGLTANCFDDKIVSRLKKKALLINVDSMQHIANNKLESE